MTTRRTLSLVLCVLLAFGVLRVTDATLSDQPTWLVLLVALVVTASVASIATWLVSALLRRRHRHA